MAEISVIVPIYNTEQYLKRCVDSIINQSFTDFELILINDGSTDGCGAMCDAYAKEDKRVRVIHQKNAGLTGAVCCGIKASDSEYTVFCDSDDMLERDGLGFLYTEIKSSAVDGVRTGMQARYKDGRSTVETVAKTQIFEQEEIAQIIQLCFDSDFNGFILAWGNSRCGKIYKTDLLKTMADKLNLEVSQGEDLIFNIRYLLRCNKVKNVQGYQSYICFLRPDSMTTREISLDGLLNVYLIMYSELKTIAAQNNFQYNALDKWINQVVVEGIFKCVFGSQKITDKISQIKRAYGKLTDKSAIRINAQPCYFAFKPGLYLISAGAVVSGVIITSLTNSALQFSAKLLGKAD